MKEKLASFFWLDAANKLNKEEIPKMVSIMMLKCHT